MTEIHNESNDDKAPWWGIAALYLMLTPFAVLAYFTFRALRLVWVFFDGTITATYAIVVFAIGGALIVAYLVAVGRQIYIEFIVPQLVQQRTTAKRCKKGR